MVVLISLFFMTFASSAFADELALWRIGASRFGTEFDAEGTTVPSLRQVSYVREDQQMDVPELVETLKDGVSLGAVRLHWRGHLCVNLRQQAGNCDVQIKSDEVKLVRQRKAGRMRMTFEFGIRP